MWYQKINLESTYSENQKLKNTLFSYIGLKCAFYYFSTFFCSAILIGHQQIQVSTRIHKFKFQLEFAATVIKHFLSHPFQNDLNVILWEIHFFQGNYYIIRYWKSGICTDKTVMSFFDWRHRNRQPFLLHPMKNYIYTVYTYGMQQK